METGRDTGIHIYKDTNRDGDRDIGRDTDRDTATATATDTGRGTARDTAREISRGLILGCRAQSGCESGDRERARCVWGGGEAMMRQCSKGDKTEHLITNKTVRSL